MAAENDQRGVYVFEWQGTVQGDKTDSRLMIIRVEVHANTRQDAVEILDKAITVHKAERFIYTGACRQFVNIWQEP